MFVVYGLRVGLYGQISPWLQNSVRFDCGDGSVVGHLADGLDSVDLNAGDLQGVPFFSSLLTGPIPSVPPVPEISQSLWKDKSRLGAEVRIVNVWRVICAQYPAVVLLVATGPLMLPGGTTMFQEIGQTPFGARGFEVFL